MQAIAEGTLQEAHAEDGEVTSALGDGSFRGVAVHRATALLLDEGRVPPDLALRFLPWLLSASPSDSLAVLKVAHWLCSLRAALNNTITFKMRNEVAGGMVWVKFFT